MIIGIYIAIPFVGIVLEKIEKKLLAIPFLISLIYFYLIPSINIILVLRGSTPLENKLYLYYTGGVYGIYLMIGYFIKKGLLKKVKKLYCVLAFFAFLLRLASVVDIHQGEESAEQSGKEDVYERVVRLLLKAL